VSQTIVPPTEQVPPPADEQSVSAELRRMDRDLQRVRSERDGWLLAILGFSVLALACAVLFVIIGVNDNEGGTSAPSAATTIDATLSEFAIDLSATEVAEGGSIEVTNAGTMVHNLAVTGTENRTANLNGGDTATLSLAGLAPGSYELLCEIPGHASAGMVVNVTIVAGDGSSGATGATGDEGATSSGASHGHASMTAEEAAAMDQKMLDSMAAFPAETVGRGNQVLEPTLLADGTKHFELTASIVDWEVRPGEVVQAWAYNGQVPGPRLNFEVGDKVEVAFTNNLPLGSDIHWHGVDVPNDQDGVSPYTQDIVQPGATYTYEFTTTETAIGMYHAHIHGDVAIPNGLFGTIYVGEIAMPAGRTVSGIEIPADLTLAQDLPMVLNDAGVIGLTLDGKSFPATAPIVVNNGDWVRITYFNEGLQAHPMHLHGFEQIVYAKDGEPLDVPYAADTILVAPGERYTVLFHADQVGSWVYHCHIINHVESSDGMFGMATAVVVQ
jgi:plastocyanin